MEIVTDEGFGEVIDQLVADPILQDMLLGLREVPDKEIMDTEGTPRWEFMSKAMDKYREAGGKIGGYVGSVAWAIARIRKERGRCHVPAYLEKYIPFIPDGARLKALIEDEELSLRNVQWNHPEGWAQLQLLRTLFDAGLLKVIGGKIATGTVTGRITSDKSNLEEL